MTDRRHRRRNSIFVFFGLWVMLLIGLGVGHAYSDATYLGKRQAAFLEGYQQGIQQADQNWRAARAIQASTIRKISLCGYAKTVCRAVQP